MNELSIFEVTTTMEKEDYRNFLFLTTFQTPDSIISLFIISIILGAIANVIIGFSMSKLFFCSLFFFLVFFVLLYAKLEKNVKATYPLDQPAVIEINQTIRFYDSHLTATNRTDANTTTTSYDNIYKIKENDSYIILFLTKELASVIRKKDLDKELVCQISNFLKQKIKK